MTAGKKHRLGVRSIGSLAWCWLILGAAFAVFEAVHFAGVEAVDKDPKAYVAANSP